MSEQPNYTLMSEQIAEAAARLLIYREMHREASALALAKLSVFPDTNDFGDEFTSAQLLCPLPLFDWLQKDKASREALEAIINEVAPRGIWIRYFFVELELKAEPSPSWRDDLLKGFGSGTHNQAVFTFAGAPKHEFEGLLFRSKTEIEIFKEFAKRGVLCMPLPVAVMGARAKYKEPDFVICHRGKWGILEIHGEEYHPPETAAREHARRREFQELGVEVYEIYDATECYNNPAKVVEGFLRLLSKTA